MPFLYDVTIHNSGQHTFFAKNVSTVLRYFDVAESENGIGFSKLALVFEIFHIFVSKSAKNTQILTYSLHTTNLMRLYLSVFSSLHSILSFLMRYRERRQPLLQKPSICKSHLM